ncbi:MAG TPA: tetratricopeptide repeat protein [Nonomuraea sp.]|nr:tetratricopeptide repeat protein [Nonomuraea sp.]
MADEVHNSLTGDNLGQVLQARDVGQVIFNAAPAALLALAGLPPATTRFLGREDELRELRTAWRRPGLSAIASGLAGIGKTELLLHAAHAAVEEGEFPGGVLFVDLQGYDDARRVSPTQALDNFLRALGVAGNAIPPEEDQRAALFRSMLVKQDRMLVVLDNASSAEQVKPLLPGISRHQVVISSRHRLNGLDDAHHFEIGALDAAASEALVGNAELARLCGYLPLALRIMAALRDEDPHTDWVAELTQAGDRLDLLDDGDSRAVHAAFDLSYSTLTPEQQRLFRLLALHPGHEVEEAGVSVLLDLPATATRRLLRELRRAHLVEDSEPGWCGFHDLMRLYSRRRLKDHDPEERRAALIRLLIHYTTMSETANNVLENWRSARTHEHSEVFEDPDQAMRWLARRRPVLTATVTAAHLAGEHRLVCRLATALNYLFDFGRHHDDWIKVFGLGLRSAQSMGDEKAECFFLSASGYVLGRQKRFDEAMRCSERALQLSAKLGDTFRHAWILRDIAGFHLRAERHEEAVATGTAALAMCRANNDDLGVARSLGILGTIYSVTKRPEEALAAHELARTIYRQMGNQLYESLSLVDLATDHRALGRFDDSLACALNAVELLRGSPHVHLEGLACEALGEAYSGLGRLSDAETALSTALELFGKVADESKMVHVRGRLAQLAEGQGG